MAIYFNELTLDKSPDQNRLLLKEFWKVMRKINEATDGRERRVLANDDGMAGLMEKTTVTNDAMLMNMIGTFFASPYQDEDAKKHLEQAKEHALETEYHISIPPQIDLVECKMLGWAYHEQSISLGFASSPFWCQLVYPVERISIDDDDPAIVESVCVTKVEQVDSELVRGWVVAQRDFEEVMLPAPCPLAPEDKHIKVQMHHGRDVVMDFEKKLCRHPLVQGIIDTIEFDSTTHRFVLKCYEDGVVDIRMHWTDNGYGVKVQTTAKGLAQTQLVADVLREKYDRRS